MTASNIKAEQRFDFLSGGGEMGRLIREFDWSGHPLGKADDWPRSLKTAISLILNSQHPMWIDWGLQMSFLYNDAYLHVLGWPSIPNLWAVRRLKSGLKSGMSAALWQTVVPARRLWC